jgi:CBS domain containing-hemolysin-like protein
MTALLLLIGLVLVLINGFFVAAEFSLVRAKASHLQHAAEAGSRRARLAVQEIQEIDSYLSACQLGVTMASIGLGFAGEPALGHIFEPWFGSIFGDGAAVAVSIAFAFLIITVLHIVIG